jgi:hypothetical protein
MKTGSKRITVEQSDIDLYARGCPINNPVAAALKSQIYTDAKEIIVYSDEIYIDGVPIFPQSNLIRWLNDWNNGRSVQPSILGFFE